MCYYIKEKVALQSKVCNKTVEFFSSVLKFYEVKLNVCDA